MARRIEVDGMDLDVVEKPKRKMSAKARKAISIRMKAIHAAKKKEAARETGTQESSKFRLVAYGNNPNTGATELHSDVKAESMIDLLPVLIDLLYSGNPMSDIRLTED